MKQPRLGWGKETLCSNSKNFLQSQRSDFWDFWRFLGRFIQISMNTVPKTSTFLVFSSSWVVDSSPQKVFSWWNLFLSKCEEKTCPYLSVDTAWPSNSLWIFNHLHVGAILLVRCHNPLLKSMIKCKCKLVTLKVFDYFFFPELPCNTGRLTRIPSPSLLLPFPTFFLLRLSVRVGHDLRQVHGALPFFAGGLQPKTDLPRDARIPLESILCWKIVSCNEREMEQDFSISILFFSRLTSIQNLRIFAAKLLNSVFGTRMRTFIFRHRVVWWMLVVNHHLRIVSKTHKLPAWTDSTTYTLENWHSLRENLPLQNDIPNLEIIIFRF